MSALLAGVHLVCGKISDCYWENQPKEVGDGFWLNIRCVCS